MARISLENYRIGYLPRWVEGESLEVVDEDGRVIFVVGSAEWAEEESIIGEPEDEDDIMWEEEAWPI